MLFHDPFQPKPSLGFRIFMASFELGSLALFIGSILLWAGVMQGGQ